MSKLPLKIRRAGALDIRAMAELLNEIIRIGGTTAMTKETSTEDFRAYFENSKRTAWHLAEDENGRVMGFQWINQIDSLPPEAASIATFARVGSVGLGIGSKLFEATKVAAKDLGYSWINADIRSDNESGLTYYQSRGFETYGHKTAVTLEDGSVVDKTLKRYDLT